jgi:hypothetical protein
LRKISGLARPAKNSQGRLAGALSSTRGKKGDANDWRMPGLGRHRYDERRVAPELEDFMLTAEQVLAKLYELRKDYADDPEDPTYLALHHAFLFASYQMEAFRKYLKEAQQGGKAAQ